jgi:hypothetical protein
MPLPQKTNRRAPRAAMTKNRHSVGRVTDAKDAVCHPPDISCSVLPRHRGTRAANAARHGPLYALRTRGANWPVDTRVSERFNGGELANPGHDPKETGFPETVMLRQ